MYFGCADFWRFQDHGLYCIDEDLGTNVQGVLPCPRRIGFHADCDIDGECRDCVRNVSDNNPGQQVTKRQREVGRVG